MARILTLTLNPALDVTVQLDQLRPGEVNRTRGLQRHAAGKGLNVAQVLADLGHKVTVAGFLGAANAAPFEALIARRGFVDAFVRVPGESRSNVKLAEDDGRITDLNGPGPEVDEGARDALLAELEEWLPGHQAVVVAGSLPRGVEPAWFGALLKRIAAHGIPLVVDSSGPALAAALAARPWLIKPNDEELGQLAGVAANDLPGLLRAAQQLREQGVGQVLLSRGAEGACWLGDGLALQARPPRVEVRSTVGAGDSLLAGALHGLLEGWPAERTLRQASAIAAQAVTQIGFGIHDREQLARLTQGVQIERLEAIE